MEAVLDDSATGFAITISGYVTRKLLKRSKCDNYKLALTSQQGDLDNDPYLKALSRRGRFTSARCLSDFVSNSFAILDYLEHDIICVRNTCCKSSNLRIEKI